MVKAENQAPAPGKSLLNESLEFLSEQWKARPLVVLVVAFFGIGLLGYLWWVVLLVGCYFAYQAYFSRPEHAGRRRTLLTWTGGLVIALVVLGIIGSLLPPTVKPKASPTATAAATTDSTAVPAPTADPAVPPPQPEAPAAFSPQPVESSAMIAQDKADGILKYFGERCEIRLRRENPWIKWVIYKTTRQENGVLRAAMQGSDEQTAAGFGCFGTSDGMIGYIIQVEMN